MGPLQPSASDVRGRRRVPPIAFLTALAGALAACGPVEPNTIVSGWSVGEVIDCTTERCRDVRQVAEQALQKQQPGYPPVISLTIHREGLYPRDGSLVPGHVAGGCCEVALFRFADGSLYAFGVGSALIGGPLEPYFEPPIPPNFDEAE